MPPTKTSLSLKKWRGKRTQAEAAELLGVPLKTLQNWEHGRNEPRGLAAELLSIKLKAKK